MVRLHTNNKCHDSTPLIMKKEKSFESVKNGKIYSILQFLKTYKKYSQKLLHVCNWKMKQGRNHWGPWGHDPPTSPPPPPTPRPPNFNFRTKQGPTVSVWKIRDIAFYEFSEIIESRNFTISTVYTTIFGQFKAAFHFSNYIGERDHFTLDFLKRSNT